jgi:ferredoxin-NADP reductase
MKEEFENMLGNNFINTITDGETDQYDHERIDEKYLSKRVNDFTKYFYICGPDPMVEAIQKDLLNLGVKKEKIVIEEF